MDFHPGAPDSGSPEDGGPRPGGDAEATGEVWAGGRTDGMAGAPADGIGGQGDIIGGPGDIIGGPGDFIAGGPNDIVSGPAAIGGGPGDTAGGPVDFGTIWGESGDDDGPYFAWLPPEDRLWRHPSERLAVGPPASAFAALETSDRAARATSWPGSGWGRTWTVAIVAGLVGALSVSVLAMSAGWWGHDTTVVRSVLPSTPSVSLADAGSAPTNWTAIDDSVAASVVSITVAGASGPRQGSGVVILNDGQGQVFVITDRSIFGPSTSEDDQPAIEVTSLSGAMAKGTLVGQDALTGVAVIRVADPGRVIPASTGSVADLHTADPVLAVGSTAASALATGAVSGEDRAVNLSDGSDMDGLIAVSMPTLAAAADGGPLLDQYGRVVAMTIGVQPVDGGSGPVTYAVPIDMATRVASDLINGRRPSHAWLGVENAADVPSAVAHQMGLTGGVQIGAVDGTSPAERAGLRAGDIITGFEGRPLASTGQLVAQLAACQPGRSVQVDYVHDGSPGHATMRLGEESGAGA